MKKLWIALILAIAIGWVLYDAQTTPPEQVYETPEIVQVEKSQNNDLKDVINEINDRNVKIQALLYTSVEIELKQVARFHLNALIAHEKPGNLRIITQSKYGKETDTGFNKDIFWLYSRRFNTPALYHMKRENLGISNLKSIYDPRWIVESLSIGKINLEKTNIVKHKGNIHVMESRVSLQGQSTTKVTSIDPKRKVIVGHYLYDSDNKIITSTEITSFYEVDGHLVPKQMQIVWNDGHMKWALKNPQINKPIPSGTFDLPEMRVKKIKLD